MTSIFCNAIGICMYVYLDDLFIFSFILEDCKRDLEYIFQKLCENKLYLKKMKCDLYSSSMDCLSHLIDD